MLEFGLRTKRESTQNVREFKKAVDNVHLISVVGQNTMPIFRTIDLKNGARVGVKRHVLLILMKRKLAGIVALSKAFAESSINILTLISVYS